MKKTYLYQKPDEPNLSLLTLEDHNDQALFETKFQDTIICVGSDIQDVIIQFSQLTEKENPDL